MTYQNQNEAGEWLIDGAALRFEQALDEQDAYERMAYDEDFFADYPDECETCGVDDPDECECPQEPTDEYEHGMEDAWLDGSYEE